MRLPLYQVDAFTSRVFGGNPAAVCPLERWLEDATLQKIAAENNLSETAFFVPRGGDYHVRWFTPRVEMDLCGHATLASAWVVFEFLDRARTDVTFESKSGPLVVRRDGDLLALDFPARPATRCETPAALEAGLGRKPLETWRAQKLMAVFATEDEVMALEPRHDRLLELAEPGVIATAPGKDVDFVSRFFAPKLGVPEDPVTGAAHCTLIPYWAQRLGKKRLAARQISERGGELACEDRGARVYIAGRAALYLEGTIRLPE